MTTKWTPGPWCIVSPPYAVFADDFVVATIPRAGDGDWSRNNARLIASAPETHAAARELLALLWDGTPERGSTLENVFNAAMALKASLDKAEGVESPNLLKKDQDRE